MGHFSQRPAAGVSRRALMRFSGGAALAGLASSAFSAPADAQSDLAGEEGQAPPRQLDTKSRHPDARIITAEQINNSTHPYVITQPGEYLLAEDVSWKTTNPNGRAITIAADNVTLNLGGATLSQIDPPRPIANPDKTGPYKGDYISGNVAIYAEGCRGITIKNGRIEGVQGVGVVLKDCSNMDILRLKVFGCGGDGVVDTSFLYRNGGIFVMGTNAGTTATPKLRFASDLRMVDCVCSDNVSALDYVVTLGSLVLFTDNVMIRNSVFSNTGNRSKQPSGVQFNVVGVDIVICRNAIIEGCEANYNNSGGEPAGFFAWGKNYKFLRCRASGNYTLTGKRAAGFNISTSDNLEMIDCEAEGNYNANPDPAAAVGSDFSATGFRIGKAIYRALIQNCRAIGNYSTVPNAPASGFALNGTTYVVMKDCVALGNRTISGVMDESSLGLALGFHACPAHPASASEPPIPCQGNVFIDCVADGNAVGQTPLFVNNPAPPSDAPAVSGNPRLCAGFYLEKQVQPKLVGCQSLNNAGRGIWLSGCAGALLERNLVASNGVSGIDNQAPVDAGIFTGNAARVNGSTHADNFVGLPPGTPVQSWTIGVMPTPDTVGGLVNTSIAKI